MTPFEAAVVERDERRIGSLVGAADAPPFVELLLASGRHVHGTVLDARAGLLILEDADAREVAVVLGDVRGCEEIEDF